MTKASPFGDILDLWGWVQVPGLGKGVPNSSGALVWIEGWASAESLGGLAGNFRLAHVISYIEMHSIFGAASSLVET